MITLLPYAYQGVYVYVLRKCLVIPGRTRIRPSIFKGYRAEYAMFYFLPQTRETISSYYFVLFVFNL